MACKAGGGCFESLLQKRVRLGWPTRRYTAGGRQAGDSRVSACAVGRVGCRLAGMQRIAGLEGVGGGRRPAGGRQQSGQPGLAARANRHSTLSKYLTP